MAHIRGRTGYQDFLNLDIKLQDDTKSCMEQDEWLSISNSDPYDMYEIQVTMRLISMS